MNGHDLKRALMRRHELARHLHPAAQAAAAVDAICGWMGWDAAALRREVAAHAAARRWPLDRAYQDYCQRALRDRLNDAKWSFVERNPHDPAAQEIIALARSWLARIQREASDEDRVVAFPTEEEAYGEPDRRVEAMG